VVEHSRPAAIPPAAVQNTREYITYKCQPRAKKVTRSNSTTDEGSDPSSLIPEVSSVPVSTSEVSAVPLSVSELALETVIYTDQQPCTRLRDGTTTRVKYGCFTSTGEPQSLSEALGDPNWKLAMDAEYDALEKKSNMALSTTGGNKECY
jgi:hypothetical protein